VIPEKKVLSGIDFSDQGCDRLTVLSKFALRQPSRRFAPWLERRRRGIWTRSLAVYPGCSMRVWRPKRGLSFAMCLLLGSSAHLACHEPTPLAKERATESPEIPKNDAPIHDSPPTSLRQRDLLQDDSSASADEAAEHDAFHRLLAAPSRDPARVAPARQLVPAVRRSNRVSFLLWSAFGETGNFVASPYSIRAALGFLYLAAEGKSRSRLQSRLAYPARPEDLDLRTLDETVRAEGAGPFESASSLWVADGDRLQREYVQAAANYLPGELHAIGFHAEPDRARRSINAWASDHSRGELRGAFPESTITAHVETVLVSTVSFSGTWPSTVMLHSFSPPPLGFSDITVKMMYPESSRAVFQSSVQAAAVDYPGTSLSLMVVKPRSWKAFAWNEAAFARLWTALSRARNAELALPILKLSSVCDLKPPLMRMGIPISDRSLSFLQAMAGSEVHTPSLDRIVHQAFIQVDSIPKPLSARAKMIRRWLEQVRLPMLLPGEQWPWVESAGPSLVMDKPYYFLVVDKQTGMILLMGQVTDPTMAAGG
jgi:serine protease inhibitor